MALTHTSYLILGMIRLGRRTGYEIKQLADVSIRLFWTVSYGQLYPELKRLEEGGLIEGEDAPTGGRQRRAYSLTAAGQEALHEWLTSDADLVYEVRDEGLLRLFFADALTTDEAIEHIRRMRKGQEEVVAHLEGIEAGAAQSENKFPYVTLRYGLELHRWIVNWCMEKERELAQIKETEDVHQAR